MNYYERHLGDYARDTGHLSILEHGVYTLLMDRYYATERGIPETQAFRVSRARTEDERAATVAVLDEFFELVNGVWIHHRIEDELAKARKRILAAKNNGARGGRPAKKQPNGLRGETHEKPSGFSLGSETETQGKPKRNPSESSPSIHTPSTTKQDKSSLASLEDLERPRPEVRACLLVRQSGCKSANPAHPNLVAAIAEGVTPDAIAATYAEGIAAGKGDAWAWALATVRSRHASGAAPIGGTGPPRRLRAPSDVPATVVYTGTPIDELPPELRQRN